MTHLKFYLTYMMLFVSIYTGLTSYKVLAHPAELIFTNASFSRYISVHVYPVSMVFNGNAKYDLHARYTTNSYHYINGNPNHFTIPPNSSLATFNHDINGANGGTRASIGFGKYKIHISWDGFPVGNDTCTVEWDYGYESAPKPFSGDLDIIFRDDNNNPRLNFIWSDSDHEYPTTHVNKQIVAWDQQYSSQGVRRLRSKNLGNFYYDNSFGNNYTIFPQDSRRDCGFELQSFEDNRSGNLTMNLTIDKDVFTPNKNEMWDFPTIVRINANSALKLNSFKTLDFTEVTPYSPGSEFEMYVGSQAFLILYSAKIIIRNHNKLVLESNGHITLGGSSEIRIKQGGLFCNKGGFIHGPGSIVYEGGHYMVCIPDPVEYISDGANIVLEPNAVLEIPDNMNFSIKGEGALVMSTASKLKVGKNAKVLFDKGAKLVTNNKEFTFLTEQSLINNSNEILNGDDLFNSFTEKNLNQSAKNISPKVFNLSQNYPNPFNPETNINYQIPVGNFVTLKIFDVAGKEVMTLVNDFKNAGSYEITFDGSELPSGIYYYKLVSGDFVSVKRMILIK